MPVFEVILVHIFPAFSRIRIEYGEIFENARKMRTKITPNMDTFYAVKMFISVLNVPLEYAYFVYIV